MFKLEYLTDYPQFILPIAELGLQEFGHLNPGQTVEDRICGLHSHLNKDNLPIAFVAIEDNQLLGTACLRHTDIDSYSNVSPWLGSVMVPPLQRNKGIGTLLVRHTMRYAISLGIKKCFLYTPNRESFYAQMGWKTIDEIIHNGVPGKIMEIVL